MNQKKLTEALLDNPVILSVKNQQMLQLALNKPNPLVFLLFGNLSNLEELAHRLLDAGKFPFVHVELISGLVSGPVVADFFLDRFGGKCGIITTRYSLTARAKEIGVPVIQRVFVLDSLSLEQSKEKLEKQLPDAVEIIPGIVPKAISYFHEAFPTLPIIAGGLITEKQEMYAVIEHGGMGVSTTNKNLWNA